MEDNHIEVIGVDHGWANCKTVGSVFVSGVKEISTEPALYDNVLEYEGKYYKIGGERLEVKETKITDENYYLLTLAAIAKELNRRGMRNANIFLAAGLPLTKFGKEKPDFIDYLFKNKQVTFRFEKETYRITIVKVAVFPQCYAAMADKMPKTNRKQIVVDIGSWTIDIMPIKNCLPDESLCDTIDEGLITCIGNINNQCVRQLSGKIDESDIVQIMMDGKSDLDMAYHKIVTKEIEEFAEGIYKKLIAHGYNLNTTPITFVGGGATVMKLFGSRKQSNINYLEDIKANAKGYEFLAKVFLNSKRGGGLNGKS